jgi:hypothetical protein
LVCSQQTKGYLSTIISAVVTEDWSQVVGACEVDSWKEALAAVLTYTKNDEFPALCGKNSVACCFQVITLCSFGHVYQCFRQVLDKSLVSKMSFVI